MPPKYKPTEANTDSRANRIVKNTLLLVPPLALSIIDSTHGLNLRSLSDALVKDGGFPALGTAVFYSWINGRGQTLASHEKKADLPSFIVPFDQGYLTAQPEPAIEYVRKHWWRKIAINVTNPDKARINGYYATVDLATKDLEQKGFGVDYKVLNPQELLSDYETHVVDSVLNDAEKHSYSTKTPKNSIPRSAWRIHNLHDGGSPLFVAHRIVQSAEGDLKDAFYPSPPVGLTDSMILKNELGERNQLSIFDQSSPAPFHLPVSSSVLPSWREQAIAAKGLDYYAREIEVEDCDPAMPSAESWAVERSPNSTQWRAVQTETRCERTVRRLLVRPEDPMTIWEEPSPKAFTEFFAHQGIDIDPPSQRSDLDAPRVNSPQASLSQPRMMRK